MAADLWLGVGVVVQRDGRVLLGLRRSALGRGCWGFPGGHAEAGEDPLATAARELHEETGLEIIDVRRAGWCSHVDAPSQRRYVTLFVQAQARGEPALREPDKCAEWHWFDTLRLPAPLFEPTAAYFS